MKNAVKTEKAPAAIGPYSQGVTIDRMVFTSGQIPVDPATGDIPEGIAAQAEQSLKNVAAVLEAAGCTMADVIKTVIFIQDMASFGTVNEIYGRYFTGPVLPARSTVEVTGLPKGVLIEIEAVALRP